MENNDKSQKMIDMEKYIELAKISCDEQLKNYNNSTINNFGLSSEEVKRLDEFFDKSYIWVIKELMEHYKLCVDGKRNSGQLEFNINVPVIVSIEKLSSNCLEYLVKKYYEKFDELSFHELGIDTMKILKKYWTSNSIPNVIGYNGEKYSFSYVMSVSCSLKKLFIKNEKNYNSLHDYMQEDMKVLK